MGLSEDLISQFVKITNDKKEEKKETTVYGTTVVYEGSTYVRIDGSELLTPIAKTANVKDNERVTVMIKNHTATVTGNISSPAARTADVEDQANAITQVEILVADKVDTETFNAEKARIDTLTAENVTIKEKLTAAEGDIDILQANSLTVTERLNATNAEIENLKTTKLDADVADLKYATAENLEATNADVYNLESTHATFVNTTTERFNALDASIADLEAGSITTDQLDARYASITRMEAAEADIDDLQADVAELDTLIFGSATGSSIQTSFANAVIAQLGEAQVKSAMIEDVSASKITSGDIVTNNVRVKSEDGKLLISDETIQISDTTRVRVQIGKDSTGDYSINIWDADGKLMFSEGGITDSAIKEAIIRNDMVSDTANIAAHKLDIDSLFEEINGSTKTIKSSRVYLDDKAQTLDVAFTQMSTDVEELQNGMSSQGTAISAMQGQISAKIWENDINTAVSAVNETTDNLSTQYESLEAEVDSVSATVASHTSQISSKADSSTVTEVNSKVSSLETNLNGFKTNVSDTYATKTNVAAIQSSVDNIEIGGRNLVSGTSKTTEHVGNKGESNYKDVWGGRTIDIPTGEEYIVSFEAKADEEMSISCFFYDPNTTTSAKSSTGSSGTGLDGHCNVWVSTEWKRYWVKWTQTPADKRKGVIVGRNSSSSNLYIRAVKLEAGNRATDWTPAPEDMATAEDNEIAQTTANKAQTTANTADEKAVSAHSLAQQLADSLATLITDANGASLMTQTSTGWVYSTGEIQSSINATSEGLDSLKNDVGDIDSAVGILQQAVSDLGVLADYVKITTYENEPCIELGETDSDFKLLITNTRILFMEGSSMPAYVTNQALNIKKAIIEEELQQGGFMWKSRSNGNLGLVWKGGNS